LQIATNFTIIYRVEERETLSQLPVVNLGEDFCFTQELKNKNISINENENNLNKIQENKRVSLEAWSKGHVADLKVRSL